MDIILSLEFIKKYKKTIAIYYLPILFLIILFSIRHIHFSSGNILKIVGFLFISIILMTLSFLTDIIALINDRLIYLYLKMKSTNIYHIRLIKKIWRINNYNKLFVAQVIMNVFSLILCIILNFIVKKLLVALFIVVLTHTLFNITRYLYIRHEDLT